MNLKKTGILLGIFAILGAYVYFVEIKQHAEEQQEQEAKKQVFNLEKDSVHVLKIHNTNGRFVIKKVQDVWKIDEPLDTQGDESTINSMLNSLMNAERDKVFSIRPDELSEYGLIDRALYVEVETLSGEKDSLRMGDKTPVGSYVFSYKTDTLVFTVNQSIKNSFQKKLYDLRDKKILHFQRADVRRIVIDRPGDKLQLEKSGTTDWRILNLDRPADNTEVSTLLSKLENNRIQSFVDEYGKETARYGLRPPRFEVQLLLGPEMAGKSLKVSDKIDGKYYAQDESRQPIFEIDSTVVNTIRQEIDEFREDDLASFNRDEIDRIEVVYGDTLFSCVKDTAGTWFMDDTSRRELSGSDISSLYSWLDYTNITEFVHDGDYNPATYGLNNPRLKIALYSAGDLQIEAKYGRMKENNVFVTTNSYNSVYLVPKTKLSDFDSKLKNILKEPEKQTESEEETEAENIS